MQPEALVKNKLTFGYLYDFRNPAQWRRPWADLYAETLDVIAWSESAGFKGVWLPEHHGAEDGYMPSPDGCAGGDCGPHQDHYALAPVDLAVRRGELVTLLGPSGCGKSTILNLFAGLIDPSEGELRWWDGTLAATGGAGRRLGFVFQSPTLMPWARVAANVRLPLDLLRVPRIRGRTARCRCARARGARAVRAALSP